MLTEVHIGVIYCIHLMIGPDPLTKFILCVFYGFMTGGRAGQGKTLTFFELGIVWLFTRCMMPCIVMLKNARPDILHEMINFSLCMNPVNVCWLKRLRG